MEHFEGHEQPVKQKSVYLLHLDTPRILLISAVIIGIIVASFLVGMNFVKDSGSIAPAASDGMFMNDNKSASVFDESIPAPPHRGDEAESAMNDAQSAGAYDLAKKDDTLPQTEQSAPADVLTGESIKEIIPPAVAEKPARKTVAKSSSPAKKIARAHKHHRKADRTREASAPARSKSQVAVVAAADSYSRNEDSGSGEFSVQVASYDRKSRALAEAETLKGMNYDTYVDSSEVNGRQFFRVRIGPVMSKNRARSILRDMQSNERYAESYIVRE
ncbi:MAG TPA: SPOR domain-containing protein [Spirochaetota bacterium]|nr:SPOR domain-containing protein [Spirochaetota bacterium]HSA16278.1 SPOR domain-containing protein [Spirochaetota bacterium]